MHVSEVTAKTDEEYALAVRSRGHGLFQSKELRDRVFKLIGFGKRGTTRNQQLHPEYVTDYVGTLETGFGNTQYQTFWGCLYTLDL